MPDAVSITVTENGPLSVKGPFRLFDADALPCGPRAWVAVPSRKVATGRSVTCEVWLGAGHAAGWDEPFEKSGFGWPGREEQFTGHGAGGVAQQQRDGDHVVEWADDGQELG